MKKILYIFMFCSTTIQSFPISVSCSSSKSDIEKIVNFDDPKTDVRWEEIMTDYSKKANDIWDSYEAKWIETLDSAYASWNANHKTGDEFSKTVDKINEQKTNEFMMSHDLQLIMAYEIGYYYCSLKRTDLVDSESILNIKDYVEQMYEGIDVSDTVHIDYPIVFYQSVTYPSRYEGVGDGIAVDFNYNVLAPKAILDSKLIDRLEKAWNLIGEDPDNPDEPKEVSLGEISIDEKNTSTENIEDAILNAYNNTAEGKKNRGYSVKEFKLTIDSKTATIIDKKDNEIPVTFNIKLINNYRKNERNI